MDDALKKLGRLDLLQGTAVIDNARLTYARFKEIFAGDRWGRLASAGARVQRPLWASTGTKNPAYPDTMYVDRLIGPDTVNTLPPATLQAFMDHGQVALSVNKDREAPAPDWPSLPSRVSTSNRSPGAFWRMVSPPSPNAFASLMHSLEEKRDRLTGSN